MAAKQTANFRSKSRRNVTLAAAGDNEPLSGAVNAASVAVLEVSKAVRMRGVEAPDAKQTYVAMDDERKGQVDEVGLPLVYDKDLIQQYWLKEGRALQQRWTEFLGYSVPYLTRIVTMLVTGGVKELEKNDAKLARDARVIMEKLGPTYIKAGQMMSVRPDVLPQAALDELAVLQDSVKPFETSTALATIERELGRPLGDVFSEISEDPVAAASLAQVYKAVLKDSGKTVAVKVQRPQVLETVSKDLYVLRRAAEVYQGLVERFAPQQRTDYVGLLNEWAVGFYTELDFTNEGRNQLKLKQLLIDEKVPDVYVPDVYEEFCTRRVLVTEWIDGVKLSECDPDEINELAAIGQEAFLVQLLQVGFFHSDPHPGNLMKMDDTSKGKIALLDFGLMASVRQEDMDTIINCIVHLANKDYSTLVDDFITLGILPPDTDRAKVEPLMDKALTPYVKGGGAKRYEEELKKMYGFEENGNVGGFQAMTQDVITVLNDIPFSIPPYFALLARAVVTLEGIALIGNPDYKLVMEAYPFVARKLLSSDRPAVQKALQEVLYNGGSEGVQGARLTVLLNSAMGNIARDSGTFVDFDTLPEDGIGLQEGVGYLLSPDASSLRSILQEELANILDILARQATRKSFFRAMGSIPPPLLPFLPKVEEVPTPFLVPTGEGEAPYLIVCTPTELIEALAPKLTREEELYALTLKDLAKESFGVDVATLVNGDILSEPDAVARVALGVLATGKTPGLENPQLAELAKRFKVQLSTIGDANPQEDSNVRDVTAALAALDPEQQQVVNGVVATMGVEMSSRSLRRLQPLIESRGVGQPPISLTQPSSAVELQRTSVPVRSDDRSTSTDAAAAVASERELELAIA